MKKYKEFEARFLKSGKTQKEFAKEHNMSASMVHYYLKRARENYKSENAFIEVNVQPEPQRKMIVRIHGNIEIEIPL